MHVLLEGLVLIADPVLLDEFLPSGSLLISSATLVLLALHLAIILDSLQVGDNQARIVFLHFVDGKKLHRTLTRLIGCDNTFSLLRSYLVLAHFRSGISRDLSDTIYCRK